MGATERIGLAPTPTISVELFGVPRVLVGTGAVVGSGRTLGALAADLAARYPALGRAVVGDDGWLVAGYTFVVDERFSRDPATPLRDGTAVLLVASAAGG